VMHPHPALRSGWRRSRLRGISGLGQQSDWKA
jgi:hypothetical protein